MRNITTHVKTSSKLLDRQSTTAVPAPTNVSTTTASTKLTEFDTQPIVFRNGASTTRARRSIFNKVSSTGSISTKNKEKENQQQEVTKGSIQNQPKVPTNKAHKETKMLNANSAQSLSKEDVGPVGCYLVYENHSGGRLMLQYSMGPVPVGAVGFWCCGEGHHIQPFKFKQAVGRSELIRGIVGGDANKRKYYAGWCQFLKLAKAKNGKVIAFRPSMQGIAVDVYGYDHSRCAPYELPLEERLVSLRDLDAVVVMAKHAVFLNGVKTIAAKNFLERGNQVGCSTIMSG